MQNICPTILTNSPAITPCTILEHPWFRKYQIKVWVKHDYRNHPTIQGNKWHKLKYNLQQAIEDNATTILTFGGAYSNHIAATAVAAKQMGIASIGIIRGEELAEQPEKWSHTLQAAKQQGMALIFISRQQYRLKHDAQIVQTLKQSRPNLFIIPEGGSNDLAIKGFDELSHQIQQQVPNWSHIFCPVGTGGTLAGLVANLSNQETLPAGQKLLNREVCGMAVLKQANYLLPEIEQWIAAHSSKKPICWRLEPNAHCGGYGKTPNYLRAFQHRIENTFGIPLDPIYTAKLALAVYHQIRNKTLPAGSEIVLLHTGGLQGRAIAKSLP